MSEHVSEDGLMAGNASMDHPSGELCECGCANIRHGKSELVHPGCDVCDCEAFRPTGRTG